MTEQMIEDITPVEEIVSEEVVPENITTRETSGEFEIDIPVPEIFKDDEDIKEIIREANEELSRLKQDPEFITPDGNIDLEKDEKFVNRHMQIIDNASGKVFKKIKDNDGIFDKEYIINKLKLFKDDEKTKTNPLYQAKLNNLIQEYESSDTLYPLLSTPNNYYGRYMLPDDETFKDLYNQTRKKLKSTKKYQFYDIDYMEECLDQLLENPIHQKYKRVFLFRFYNYLMQTQIDKCAIFGCNVIINTYKYIKNFTTEDKEFNNKNKFISSLIELIERNSDCKKEINP